MHKAKIWTKSAHISATILMGGKLVGTWNYKKVGSKLLVSLRPFDDTLFGVDRDVTDGNPIMRLLKKRAARLAAYFHAAESEVEVQLPHSTEEEEEKNNKKKRKGISPCFYGARCRNQNDPEHTKKLSHPQPKNNNKNKKQKKQREEEEEEKKKKKNKTPEKAKADRKAKKPRTKKKKKSN